jgi:ACS family hexuronate transporter-like MFS transporter
MLIFACTMPISMFVISSDSLMSAVVFISLATAVHQGWSANMFTVASDAFPKRAVGSVVGFGGMCGAIGGMFMQLLVGGLLQWLNDFRTPFILAGIMHPISFILIRLLTGKTIQQVDVDRGLRTAFSPRLLAGGVALALLGGAGAHQAWQHWDTILAVTKNSTATAAGGIAGGILVALIGGALMFASREQKVPAAA